MAGSEKFDKFNYQPSKTNTETRYINKSLTFLESLIINIDNKNDYINFRNSLLTLILKKCFIEETNIICVINLNPIKSSYQELLNTLRFAMRIKKLDLSILKNPKNNTNNKKISNKSEEVILLKEELSKIKELYEQSLKENKKLLNKITKNNTNFDKESLNIKIKDYLNNKINELTPDSLEEANYIIKELKNNYNTKLENVKSKFLNCVNKIKQYDEFHSNLIKENSFLQ